MKSILKKTALLATLIALGTGTVAPKRADAFVAIHGSVYTSDPFQMMAGLTL